MSSPSPRQILETLLPHLRVAAAYARQIQSRIAARPSKPAESIFGAALSDADLSIQTLVEVALLGSFPHLRFHGEEYDQSYNTKYFRSIDLGEDTYLVTLDPIDGTQFYLDGHSNYQIILSILSWDDYEAAIAITPAENTYYYALRGEGCWQGSLDADLDSCKPLQVQTNGSIYLGWGMEAIAPHLADQYQVISVANDYSAEHQIPNVNGVLTGDLSGAILRGGKWIDAAALAFLAQEAGGIVTTWTGDPLPPLHQHQNYERPPLAIAANASIHQDLVRALKQFQVKV